MGDKYKHTSKLLSLALRHKPDSLGISLDANGWADVNELIANLNARGTIINMNMLDELVTTNDKKRFTFNEAKTKIRASQGHSLYVDLALKEQVPPAQLFHGTVEKFINNIKEQGLQKMSRQHVHLSNDIATAQKVGSRRGKPIVLVINSHQMYLDGLKFYLSENGVWLTDSVPPVYITYQ